MWSRQPSLGCIYHTTGIAQVTSVGIVIFSGLDLVVFPNTALYFVVAICADSRYNRNMINIRRNPKWKI